MTKEAVKAVAEVAEKMSAKRCASRAVADMEAAGKLRRKVKLVDKAGKPTGAVVTAADVLRGVGEIAKFELAVQDGKRPTHIICQRCPPDSPDRFVPVSKKGGKLPTLCASHRAIVASEWAIDNGAAQRKKWSAEHPGADNARRRDFRKTPAGKAKQRRDKEAWRLRHADTYRKKEAERSRIKRARQKQ